MTHASDNAIKCSRTGPCSLCGRVTRKGTTAHHLIPRRCHRNKWFKKRFDRNQMNTTVAVCIDCHRHIHKTVPREKDLGRYYNTLQTLREHPEIAKFVHWVKDRR